MSVVMIRYQHFNFETISVRYFENIDIDIFEMISTRTRRERSARQFALRIA